MLGVQDACIDVLVEQVARASSQTLGYIEVKSFYKMNAQLWMLAFNPIPP
jgi:hypothetical protein